jgi:putative transcriptional regulator
MITHHLTDELLLDYAAGGANEAMALLVATHLSFCPTCRGALARQEAIGGAMLDDLAPVPVAADAFAALLDRMEDRPPKPAAPRSVRGRLPAPLAAYVPDGIDGLAWRPVTRGVKVAPLDCGAASGRLSLMRFSPGRSVPRHTHRGSETIVVLEGGFTDEFGHYGAADVSIADESVEHSPVGDAGGECLCLIVADGPIQFTGRFARLLNPFVSN